MRKNSFGLSSAMRVTAAVAVFSLALACGGGGDQTADTTQVVQCPTPADSIVGGALETFITTRSPVPHRFLVPLGTPEAVPEGAQYSLYARGRQQYLWPADSGLQKQQISNMRSRGKDVTVVLYYHGMEDMPDGRKALEFSAQYVDLANEKLSVPRTKVYFNCQATGADRFQAGDQPPPAGNPAPAAGGAGG